MGKLTVGGAAVLTLLVVACGGGDADSTATTTTEEATPTTQEATTTTEKTGTVEQVAGVIAQHDRDLLDAMEEAKPCTEVVLHEYCDLSARLAVFNVEVIGATLEIGLRAFDDDKPRNELYVGAYPEEVRPLVEETLKAVRQAKAAAEDWPGACKEDLATEECVAASHATRRPFASLERVLNKWRPYL